MKVRFWGTRGSIPRPSPETMRHGGNTSCVSVRCADGTLMVLDCGTGAWELGRALLAESSGEGQHQGHLLIGHTHWDHVQGFPFFAPLFSSGWSWDVFAPTGLGRELERILAGQMSYEYFPITIDSFAAKVRYHDLTEGEMFVGNARVLAQYLNHPAVTLGYRIEKGGVSVVYATDHEPHASVPVDVSQPWSPVHHEDIRHVEFMRGADLVIHDTQYTEEEYPNRIGWGHTPVERAIDSCIDAGVGQLALFHHDPARTDEQLDAIVDKCRERIARAGSKLVVFAAREGQEVELEEDRPGAAARPTRPRHSSRPQRQVVPEETRILVVDDDPELLQTWLTALEADRYVLLSAANGAEALITIQVQRPHLLLIDVRLGGASGGLELLRSVRALHDTELSTMPIVMITDEAKSEKDLVASFGEGVTDFLTKPVKPSYLRARVSGWLMRGSESS